MLIAAAALAVALFAVLRVLQARWGLDTTAEVFVHAVAMTLPTVGTSQEALMRRIARLLPGASVASASGARAAAGMVRIRVGTASLETLDEGFTLSVLAVEYADVYRRHAERQGWRLPLDRPRVEFVEDVRLRPGRVLIDTVPGAYPRRGADGTGSRGGGSQRGGGQSDSADAGQTVAVPTELDRTVVAPRSPAWSLEPVVGAAAIGVIPADRRLTVGRGRDCDLAVPHPHVSRRHAALSVRPDGVLVEDLGSTNGTWAGATRLGRGATHLLRDGDRVSFGESGPVYAARLVTEGPGPAGAAAPAAARTLLLDSDGVRHSPRPARGARRAGEFVADGQVHRAR